MRKSYKILKKQLYNASREYVKRYLTSNLGKVAETDQGLICYVTKKKCKKGKYDYTISCWGIGKENRELAEKFDLNKSISYVLDGLHFERKKVNIFGYDNCIISIRNCQFNWDLYVHVKGKCVLEHTSIQTFGILSMSASEMVLKNMNLSNPLALVNHLNMYIEAGKKLDIIDSNIGRKDEKTTVSLQSANQFNLIHSNLAGDQVNCKSKSISSDTASTLIAENEVHITTDDFKQLCISSPSIIYNGNTLTNDNEFVRLENVIDPLRVKQLELVQLLKKLKTVCEEENIETKKEVKEHIDNRPVHKILKKI